MVQNEKSAQSKFRQFYVAVMPLGVETGRYPLIKYKIKS